MARSNQSDDRSGDSQSQSSDQPQQAQSASTASAPAKPDLEMKPKLLVEQVDPKSDRSR